MRLVLITAVKGIVLNTGMWPYFIAKTRADYFQNCLITHLAYSMNVPFLMFHFAYQSHNILPKVSSLHFLCAIAEECSAFLFHEKLN